MAARRIPNEIFIQIFAELKRCGAEATLATCARTAKDVGFLATAALLRTLSVPHSATTNPESYSGLLASGLLSLVRELRIALPEARAVQGPWAAVVDALLTNCTRLNVLEICVAGAGSDAICAARLPSPDKICLAKRVRLSIPNKPAASNSVTAAQLLNALEGAGDRVSTWGFFGPCDAFLDRDPGLVNKLGHLGLFLGDAPLSAVWLPPNIESLDILDSNPLAVERILPILDSTPLPKLKSWTFTVAGFPDLRRFTSKLHKLHRISFGSWSGDHGERAARNLSLACDLPEFAPREVHLGMIAFAHKPLHTEWTAARFKLWTLPSIERISVSNPYEGGLASFFEDTLPASLREITFHGVRSESLRSFIKQASFIMFHYRTLGKMPFDEDKCRLAVVEVGKDGKETVWVWRRAGYRFVVEKK